MLVYHQLYLLNAFERQTFFLLKSQKAIVELLTLMYLYNNLAVVIEFYINFVNYLAVALFRPVNVLDPVNCVYRHIVFHLYESGCGCWVLGRAKASREFFHLIRG